MKKYNIDGYKILAKNETEAIFIYEQLSGKNYLGEEIIPEKKEETNLFFN